MNSKYLKPKNARDIYIFIEIKVIPPLESCSFSSFFIKYSEILNCTLNVCLFKIDAMKIINKTNLQLSVGAAQT